MTTGGGDGAIAGGGSAGGFNQYELGRCTVQGYIAGQNAAAERFTP